MEKQERKTSFGSSPFIQMLQESGFAGVTLLILFKISHSTFQDSNTSKVANNQKSCNSKFNKDYCMTF